MPKGGRSAVPLIQHSPPNTRCASRDNSQTRREETTGQRDGNQPRSRQEKAIGGMDPLIPNELFTPLSEEQTREMRENVRLSEPESNKAGNVVGREQHDVRRDDERQLIQQIRDLTSQLEDLRGDLRRRDRLPSVGTNVTEAGWPAEQVETIIDQRPYVGGGTREQPAETQIVPFGVRLPRGGWIKNPFEELEFRGKSDRQNPVMFIEKFERIARYEQVSEEEQIFHFGRSLKGAAANWYDLQSVDAIGELKQLFKERFWGCQAQMRFRHKVYFGKYKTGDGPMTEYALSIARQARTLVPPMTDEEIVQTVRLHFDTDVQRELRPSVVKNVSELIAMLDSLENERETRRMRNESRGRSGGERTPSGRPQGDDYRAETRSNAPTGKQDARVYQSSIGRENRDRRVWGAQRGYWEPSNRGASWRRPEPTNAERDNGINIVELPDSDDGERKPKVTTYTRDRNGNAVTRNAREGGARTNYNVRDKQGRESKKVAAITANGSDHESEEQTANDGSQAECSESNESCCTIINADHQSRDYQYLNIMRMREIINELDEEFRGAQKQTGQKRPEIPMVDAIFGTCATRALIDTGAQITAMTNEFFGRLNQAGISMQIIPIKRFVLRGAFNERGSSIARKVRVAFVIKDKKLVYEFYIVEKLAFDVVLGIDFLDRFSARMACMDGEFDVQLRSDDTNIATVHVMRRDEADETLRDVLAKNARVFDDGLGCAIHYKHRIEVDKARSFKKKTYPIPEVHMEKVRQYISRLEKTGVVTKQATQYINPLVVVVKKSGDIRLCLDARELNKQMTNDYAQPPTIDEVFQRIGHNRYFSTLDISNAFWQIPLEEESRQFTGFLFDGQTYVFNRMPFGLKTAGASFTRAMNLALGQATSDFMITYLDDILIASSSLEEHLYHIELILGKLASVGFKLNRSKCEFLQERISFLGHTFDQIKAEINEETRLAIANFERPRNKKAIQSFLGLINWDRRFIKNLARLTRPLEILLKKDKKFVWGHEQQEAFSQIKDVFREAPDLFLIRKDHKFGMFVDAARTGLGARLYQYREGEDERLTVGYASRSLKGAEQNYTVTELECLAIVWALRKWHTLLLGRHVRIHTDHQALKFMSTCVQNNPRIARWFSFLQEFDIEIVHLPGKQNDIADALSRAGTIEGQERDEKRIALINDPRDGADTRAWIQIIRDAQSSDKKLQRAKIENPETVYERQGLLRLKCHGGDRVVLPQPAVWRITREAHRLLVHFGTDRVFEFMRKIFTGPNLARVCRDVVASCETCQATKFYTRPSVGQQYFEMPEHPGDVVALDIFGPLPRTAHGDRYILVLMDVFSKYVKLYIMPDQKAETIIENLEDGFFEEIGVPRTILTDNGTQFSSARWLQLARNRGFLSRYTSPYNPQSNPVERVMRELGRVIRAYASHKHYAWHRIVERAEQVMNGTTHSSTGFTPRELNDGEEGMLPIDPSLVPLEDNPVPWATKVKEARRKIAEAAAKRKRQADKKGTSEYQHGQKVWVRVHQESDAGRGVAKKLYPVYEGPYRVRHIVHPNAYMIERMDGHTKGMFNARQMRPHREPRLERCSDGESEKDSAGSEEDDEQVGDIGEEATRNINTMRVNSEDDSETEQDNQNDDEAAYPAETQGGSNQSPRPVKDESPDATDVLSTKTSKGKRGAGKNMTPAKRKRDEKCCSARDNDTSDKENSDGGGMNKTSTSTTKEVCPIQKKLQTKENVGTGAPGPINSRDGTGDIPSKCQAAAAAPSKATGIKAGPIREQQTWSRERQVTFRREPTNRLENCVRKSAAETAEQMDEQRLADLARRREAALETIIAYQRQRAEMNRAEQLVRALEEYARSLPPITPGSEALMHDWQRANDDAIRTLAECEEAQNREVATFNNIAVNSDVDGRLLASLNVMVSIDRPRGELGYRATPFHLVVECSGDRVSVTTMAGRHPRSGEAAATAALQQQSPSGNPTEDGVACQADIPVYTFYGQRDPRIHARTKFRPDRIDPYGLPIGSPTVMTSPRSGTAESVGCQADLQILLPDCSVSNDLAGVDTMRPRTHQDPSDPEPAVIDLVSDATPPREIKGQAGNAETGQRGGQPVLEQSQERTIFASPPKRRPTQLARPGGSDQERHVTQKARVTMGKMAREEAETKPRHRPNEKRDRSRSAPRKSNGNRESSPLADVPRLTGSMRPAGSGAPESPERGATPGERPPTPGRSIEKNSGRSPLGKECVE